ncbi:MAG TPA: 50S ribosomal protein L11 methyltransferase [Blastocatellia bacterium]|nr:50S ribosomal protein L11 methyltransferase [Blastocatellia bacterium]
MKNSDGTEASLFNHATELFKGHEKLLGDEVRNLAFYEALKSRVTPGASVLDIGSGTGIWAIVAARLGAKRVVAVEQDPLLIGLIRSLANANGVSDRVEAVAGDSRQMGFGQKFDIVISETIGNLAFEEQIIPIMIDARRRLLNPGGILIPQSVSLVASAAHLKPREAQIPAGISLEYEGFEWLARNIPVGLDDNSRLKLLSDPQELEGVDLTTIEELPEFAEMTARWEIETASEVNGFAVWAEAGLTDEVKLNTLKTTSWTPLIYRVSPFTRKRGLLELKLTLTSTSNYWTATLSTEGDIETQAYSPAYAASLLVAQGRTGVDLIGSPQRISFTGPGKCSGS